MRSQLKAQPLCTKPVSGMFTGSDKYLKLQSVTLREATPPIAEDDSLLVYVTAGTGYITINGVVFDLRPGVF
ncbi:MAG: AraC family transcriptional regulator, partial [Oscillospiraceae bacterium]|nr:AraC family transcriptional regulator [Oscillospiraceae bacterium]